jgi:Mg/Co/Ni transporter MgtE
MIAEDLINQMIPALKVTDLAEKAIIWMEELKINQLPVIESGKFKGLITEDAILESNDLSKPIGEFLLTSENCYVVESQHFFDILKVALEKSVQIVAVIDEKKNFIGVTSYEDALNEFAKTVTIQSPGGIIVISLKHRDYSLVEISRIIEGNNAKILGVYVAAPYPDSDHLYLTIKLNVTDLATCIAGLERFNYEIIAKFNDIDRTETTKERLDHLLRYLDI